MGNSQGQVYLNSVGTVALEDLDQDMIQEYRAGNIQCLTESYDTWMLPRGNGGEICGAYDVNEDQFDEIFGAWIGDTEPFFDYWKRKMEDGVERVSMYSCFSGISAFVQGTLEERLGFVFNLFDFDQSGKLSNQELQILIKYSLRGLNRLTHKGPKKRQRTELSKNQLDKLTADLLYHMDDDKDGTIEMKEFYEYVLGTRDVFNFLHNLQEMTDISKAIEQCKARWMQVRAQFDGHAKNKEVSLEISMELFKNCIKGSAAFEHDEKRQLTEHVDAQGHVSLFVFEALARGIIAFDIVDRPKNNFVHMTAMLVLMEVRDWECPNIDAQTDAVSTMDKHNNDDDMLTRLEWINFCAPPRELNDLGYYEKFSKNVQKLFKEHDYDNSEKLSKDELGRVLFDSLVSVCPKSMLPMISEDKEGGSMRKNLVQMSDSLAQEMLDGEKVQQLSFFNLHKNLDFLWERKVQIMQWLYTHQNDHVGRILGFDENNSNSLDMEELQAYLVSALHHFTEYCVLTIEEAEALAEKTAVAIKNEIDTDNDGHINKDELDHHKDTFIRLEADMLHDVEKIRKQKLQEAKNKVSNHFNNLKVQNDQKEEKKERKEAAAAALERETKMKRAKEIERAKNLNAAHTIELNELAQQTDASLDAPEDEITTSKKGKEKKKKKVKKKKKAVKT